MTKKEALEKLDSIEEDSWRYDLSDLRQYIEESCQEPKPVDSEFRVKPEEGQRYWYLEFNDEKNIYEVLTKKWEFLYEDTGRYFKFNCFLSKEKAELACRRKNAWLKLQHLEEEWAREHGWPDWSNKDQYKMYVYCVVGRGHMFDLADYYYDNNCYFAVKDNNEQCQDWIIERMGDQLDDLFLVVIGN